MKITEVLVEEHEQQEEQLTEATISKGTSVFGISRHDPLHAKVAKEIDNLRDTDPNLYHKIISLN